MKNFIKFLLLVCLALFANFQVYANNSTALDQAISELWLAGPSKEISKTLTSSISSSDKQIAGKSIFHLACLKIMNGDKVKALALLEQLKNLDSNPNNIKLAKRLKNFISDTPTKTETEKGFPNTNKISFDFRNTSLHQLLKLIARQAKVNLVIHKDVKGQLSMKLKNTPINDAFDAVCKAADLHYEINNGIYIVMPYYKKDIAQKYQREEIEFKWLTSIAAKKTIENLNSDFKDIFVTLKGENKIAVDGEPHRIDELRKFLKKKDKAGEPHVISLKFWQFNEIPKIEDSKFANLSTKEKQKIAKLVAAPKVVALPNLESKICLFKPPEKKDGLSYTIKLIYDLREDKQMNIYVNTHILKEFTKNNKQFKSENKSSAKFILSSGSWFSHLLGSPDNKMLIELKVQPKSKGW